jgi:hypothetical protein
VSAKADDEWTSGSSSDATINNKLDEDDDENVLAEDTAKVPLYAPHKQQTETHHSSRSRKHRAGTCRSESCTGGCAKSTVSGSRSTALPRLSAPR